MAETPTQADRHLLALAGIQALGPAHVHRLVRYFGSAEAVFKAPYPRLADTGAPPAGVKAIAEYRGWGDLEQGLRRIEAEGARVVALGDAEYPESIAELGPDAPPALYVKGSLVPEDRFSVAIVGSRAASDYGRIATERIAGDLGAIGLAVISGMALGVDTHAHRGCIEAGGRTVAVLGSGLDVVYPASNRGLMGKILATGGAVISEFQPGTRPLKPNFPRRNRLISGLALGVIVVEAALRSGSLITARFALEQGKEVFAVPGTILSRTSEGANALIRDGAKMATSAEHVVAELAPVLKGFIQSIRRAAPASEEKGDGGSSAGHSGDEGAVAAALGPEPRHVDEITRELGLGAARTVAALLGLELRGVVKQLEGKRFYLARQGR